MKDPMSDATVTVVVRTQNRALFLPRALRSILAQTTPHWHIVLINDGGSVDAVEEAIAPYLSDCAGRLTVCNLPGSVGMEAASNCAIALRSDPFITIHDDDDSWYPDFLSQCVLHLQTHAAGGVVTATELVEERVDDGRISPIRTSRFLPDMRGFTLADLWAANRFPPISYVFRRSLYVAIGPYRADLPVLGDWEFNLRAMQHAPIDMLPDLMLARWHRRPSTDGYPNSDDTLHRTVERKLRDEWARQAPAGISAEMGQLRRDVDVNFQALHAEIRQICGRMDHELQTLKSAMMDLQPRVDRPEASTVPMAWGLVPSAREQIEGPQPIGKQTSTGNDPKLLYRIPIPLPPGTYRIQLDLDICLQHPADKDTEVQSMRAKDANTGIDKATTRVDASSAPAADMLIDRVELFYSATSEHAESRCILLERIQQRTWIGDVTLTTPFEFLRIDPMQRPGVFSGGACTITPHPIG